MRRPAVLYHYPCPDGAFAALAAHLYFSSKSIQPFFFPNAVYSPVTAQSLPLSDIDELYLLDFVGPPGFVQEVSLKVPNVVVLDHHKTAVGRVGGVNVTSVLDMKRSGATIAFDYFRGKVDVDGGETARFDGVRRVFEYIEDGDLWRWRLPDSKAFSSGFKDLNLQYDVGLNPALFQQLLSLDLECLISQGMVSLSEKQKLIEEALSQSYEIKLGGGAFGHCLAVNADSISELRSELGHQLATKSRSLNLRGIGAVVYKVPELENDELLKISLRSVDSEDTTRISQEFGGGGHRNASSFMLGSAEFEQWKVGQAIIAG
ncbi:PREDICTED: uncharacterized protein R106-like [Fragaria vesca subsp. vesca]|uniref:uncharacterized protein LOC101292120 n=1 Tax=Fragaria vesca subsp. vesca TaxID=101020 RepID=UPI0002C3058B|nr:PREDICTED: uncharacterized protein LOC101292120 [Fragaria vesca subsp. vesca]